MSPCANEKGIEYIRFFLILFQLFKPKNELTCVSLSIGMNNKLLLLLLLCNYSVEHFNHQNNSQTETACDQQSDLKPAEVWRTFEQQATRKLMIK